MVVRVSPDDIVLYANGGMADYLRITKANLIGAPLEALATRAHGEVAACFHRPEGGKRSTSLVTDSAGRVFEVKVQSDGGVMDIVFDEVSTSDSICRDLRAVSGTSVDTLNEEELRTARSPERRFLTVSQSRLNGVTHLAGRLDPLEIQLMVNSFVEEASDAIMETGCTAYPVAGEVVTGVYGAPRYFADHSLRAILAACAQIDKTAKLTSGFCRQGKEMPPMSCGIWTGEVFIGSLGNSKTRSYSSIGQPVDFAAELCRLARPGEVLVGEPTLKSMTECLPAGWQAIRAESQLDPDLGDFQWGSQGVEPLANDLVRGIWLVGPGIDTDTSLVEFYLEYLWSLRISSVEPAIPILRVVRPMGHGSSLELSENNVVSSQFVQTLGKYKLISVIGTGGMGKVWKAIDRYGNTVAIKVLHSSETTTEAQIRRFRREAEIMAKLPHRNICRVLEMNEFDGIQYLVMEFVDGLTLSELLSEHIPTYAGSRNIRMDIQQLISAIRSEKSSRSRDIDVDSEGTTSRKSRTCRILPIEQALNLFMRICDAVQFAHEHGVLHRDLKPGNILLREDGEPLVADFGLAKVDFSGDSGASLSVSGHIVGTLENMSPEQAESSKDVDERADLYSLGTILYQMVTGHRHFDATGNIVSDGQALQTHEPIHPKVHNPKLDTDLDIIIMKCLRISPLNRYRSIAALKADIQHYIRGEAITARPVSAIELLRKIVMRNKMMSAVIVSSIIILATTTSIAFIHTNRSLMAAQDAAQKLLESTRRAQEAQRLAEEQKKIAEEKTAEAKLNLALANEQIQKVRKAEDAAMAAKGEAVRAEANTEEQRRANEAALAKLKVEEDRNKQLQENLAKGKSEGGSEGDRQSLRMPPGILQPPPSVLEAATKQYNDGSSMARRVLRQQLTADQLALYSKNPDMVLSRINEGMEGASKALLSPPTSSAVANVPNVWMLKGRLHLACLEIKSAIECFRKAAEISVKNNTGTPTQLSSESNSLIDICEKLLQMSSFTNDRFTKGAAMLDARETSDDHVVAGIMTYFKERPNTRHSNSYSPLGRRPTNSEQLLSIILQSGGYGKIIYNDGGIGKDITILGIQKLLNLAPLEAINPTKIRIYDAEFLDHNSLANLTSLETLDISGCPIAQLPPPYRRFRCLRNFTSRDTKIYDLSILSGMPTLEYLNISNSYVSDLGALAYAKSLKEIDAGSLSLKNCASLRELPYLSKLTISPELITDKTTLVSIQQLSRLQVLRSPADPYNQSPSVFWHHLTLANALQNPPPASNPPAASAVVPTPIQHAAPGQ